MASYLSFPSIRADANPLTKHLHIALLDRQPPVALPDQLPLHADIRVSTLTPASIALLHSVGAWRSLAPAAAPFVDMQVVLCTGRTVNCCLTGCLCMCVALRPSHTFAAGIATHLYQPVWCCCRSGIPVATGLCGTMPLLWAPTPWALW